MSERDRKVEVLKVWYSIFTAIMDTSEPSTRSEDWERFEKLRQRLKHEAPELEAN